MSEAVRPAPWRPEETGRWIAARPSREGPVVSLSLGADRRLGGDAVGEVVISTPQHCGTAAGEYFTLAPNADLPGDQRGDDALSECWETGELDAPLDLLGRPHVDLDVAIDRAQGNLIGRLVDVHPDGTASLIARGVLNLCHRNGHAAPEPMEPGRVERVRVIIDETAYRVRAGHRLRVALSTAYWPMIQPSPAPVTARVSAGPGAVLHLPVAGPTGEHQVPAPDGEALPAYPVLEDGGSRREVRHDLSAGRVRYVVASDTGLIEVPRNGMQMRETRDEVWEIDPADPLSSTGRLQFSAHRQRGSWRTRTEARIDFSCTAETFDVSAELVAWDGEDEFARRSWSFSVPRDHV